VEAASRAINIIAMDAPRISNHVVVSPAGLMSLLDRSKIILSPNLNYHLAARAAACQTSPDPLFLVSHWPLRPAFERFFADVHCERHGIQSQEAQQPSLALAVGQNPGRENPNWRR
jgi:hypothetical protein